MIPEEIEKYRAALKAYDDGDSTQSECLSALQRIVTDSLLENLEKGEEVFTIASCCCSSHPPPRAFSVRFVIGPHGYQAKRIDG